MASNSALLYTCATENMALFVVRKFCHPLAARKVSHLRPALSAPMTDSRVSVPTNRLGSRHSQRTNRRRMAACSADVVYAYTCGGHVDKEFDDSHRFSSSWP